MPPRFETLPYGSLDSLGSRGNGTSPFSAERNLQYRGLQPRGKTARELTVGRKLRELREQRHLTQQEMAGKAGVPRTYISRIENARLLPGPVMLGRIADALAVAILDLLPQTKNGNGQPGMEEDPYWASFVSYFSQLKTADMDFVVSHVRGLVAEDKSYHFAPEALVAK